MEKAAETAEGRTRGGAAEDGDEAVALGGGVMRCGAARACIWLLPALGEQWIPRRLLLLLLFLLLFVP